jgi:prepilin-type processing-associated H-X9-DG protein/prepilin-type N-terminal cleavage/methylation domain-containing protein
MNHKLASRSERRGFQRPRNGVLGFTLVELLVVIAIIAVLTALVLTGVVAAKKRVAQAQCAHNVTQLGLGVQLFVADNHVYPLTVNPKYREGLYPEHQTAWMTAIRGVLARGDPVHPNSTNAQGEGIWICPAAPRPGNFPEWQGFVSYGYNDYGLSTRESSLGLGGQTVWLGDKNGSAPPVSETEVVNPTQLILLGDGFEGGKGIIRDGLTIIRRKDTTQDYLGSTARALGRHKQKANVVFCDGHVETPTLKNLFEDNSDSALTRWNRDNQPHRNLLSP